MCHALLLVAAFGWSAGADPGPARVGQVFVCGNVVTAEGLIRSYLPIYPGQSLALVDLQAAGRHLRILNFWGIGSTVTVLDPEGPGDYKDVLVTVRETPFTYLVLGLPLLAQSWLRGR